jgi:hypothetical protein
MEIKLNQDQKRKIRDYIDVLKKCTKSEEFKKDIQEREEREKYFKGLTEEKIKNLSEFDLGELVSRLWASQFWGNKNYLIQKILEKNKIVDLRSQLCDLFFGSEDVGKRYENFLNSITGLGPASVTELLCFFNPQEHGIWNDKARKALKTLGFSNIIPIEKYRITGEEYKRFIDILKEINRELKSEGFGKSDLLFVDYFLYKVWRKPKTEEEYFVDFDHDEIRDKIIDIGLWLGFETETEKIIGHGAKVDVIWRAKIANLGVVTYIFEVHKSGSIDSLILNLQKSKRNPTVQKIIAVSDNKQLEKIGKEAIGLPEDFRKSLSVWDVIEVQMVHQHLSEVIKGIEKLELVKREFEMGG